MAKGAYVGVDGKARKITSGYVGVSGKARKIVKAYVGIGGVARPCWSAGKKLEYYGAITPLSSSGNYDFSATTVGDYALFGGSLYYRTIDAYDKSLTRSTAEWNTQRNYLSATTVGNYALFAGGYNGGNFYTTVDAYDTSLTRSTPTALIRKREDLAATTIGNYALFGGGYSSTTVDAYTLV